MADTINTLVTVPKSLSVAFSSEKGLNVADEQGDSAVVLLDESQAIAVISIEPSTVPISNVPFIQFGK